MKTTLLKVSRIGNSRGIRLPATMLRKYRITESVLLEEQADQIILRAVRTGPPKLTWEQTYQEMAASEEDWTDWEGMTADGLEEVTWEATKKHAAKKTIRSSPA